LVLRVANRERNRLPIPLSLRVVPEVTADVSIAIRVIRRGAVQASVDIEEDVLAVEHLGVGRIGRAPAAIAAEPRAPLLAGIARLQRYRAVVLRPADNRAGRWIAGAAVELRHAVRVDELGPAADARQLRVVPHGAHIGRGVDAAVATEKHALVGRPVE